MRTLANLALFKQVNLFYRIDKFPSKTLFYLNLINKFETTKNENGKVN
jgi:hypothetical protein